MMRMRFIVTPKSNCLNFAAIPDRERLFFNKTKE
jgi:hypothetical protein